MRILVVGIDAKTRAFLKEQDMDISHQEMTNVREMYDHLRGGSYDVVLADLDAVPWGVLAVSYLRSREIMTPFVAVSKGDGSPWSRQCVQFLEKGGDDLLHSPVNLHELAAVLRAVTRCRGARAAETFEFIHGKAVIRVNISSRQVSVNGTDPRLGGKEMRTLCVLARADSRPLSKQALLDGIYEGRSEPGLKGIDVLICNLRHKLSKIHPDAGMIIETAWGCGYRIVSDEKLNRNAAVA